MREIRHAVIDVDTFLEHAARAKQQHDIERWREELRPRAMRLFAARTAKLPWSRALVKLLVEELYPDDLFAELIGRLDRVPPRQWPRVIAIALALRHSGRRDGLARVARRLHVSLATKAHLGAIPQHNAPDHHNLDCLARLGPVKALRFASTLRGGAHGLDGASGEPCTPAFT